MPSIGINQNDRCRQLERYDSRSRLVAGLPPVAMAQLSNFAKSGAKANVDISASGWVRPDAQASADCSNSTDAGSNSNAIAANDSDPKNDQNAPERSTISQALRS